MSEIESKQEAVESIAESGPRASYDIEYPRLLLEPWNVDDGLDLVRSVPFSSENEEIPRPASKNEDVVYAHQIVIALLRANDGEATLDASSVSGGYPNQAAHLYRSNLKRLTEQFGISADDFLTY
jgi:hypothetical protein